MNIQFDHLKNEYKSVVAFCENELKKKIDQETLFRFLKEISIISPTFTITQFPNYLFPIVKKYFTQPKSRYQIMRLIISDTFLIYPALWNFLRCNQQTSEWYIDVDAFLSFRMREFQSLKLG